MAYKGYFQPQNPSKYEGQHTNIIYRSSWELKYMIWLDKHPDVLKWSSEEFFIPYLSPIDGKVHRYYPDFKVKRKNKDGVIETIVVEVKPEKQTKEPVVQKKKTKSYLTEVYTWGVNQAKWKAAKNYCADRQWQFLILTEKDLGIIYNG
jgi:hypothetical protein